MKKFKNNWIKKEMLMGEEKELLVMLHGSRNLKENNIIEIQE